MNQDRATPVDIDGCIAGFPPDRGRSSSGSGRRSAVRRHESRARRDRRRLVPALRPFPRFLPRPGYFDEVTCVDWTRVSGGAASTGHAGAASGATGEATEETEDAGLVEVVLKGIGWIILALLTP